MKEEEGVCATVLVGLGGWHKRTIKVFYGGRDKANVAKMAGGEINCNRARSWTSVANKI